MRVAANFGVLILISVGSSVAQTGPPAQNPTLLRSDPATFRTPVVPGCPVDMHVRQGIGGALVAVDENGVKRPVFAPQYRLFLNDVRKPGQKIVSATVTVRGWNGKARALPADSDSNLKFGSIQRTVTVNLAGWGEPGVEGDFRLPGFTSASRVDLQAVTYEDGSTWKLASTDTCRVAPDPVMLVGH